MTIEITLVLLAIIVMGLTEIIKNIAGKEYKEFIPLMAIALGIVFVFGYQYAEGLTTNLLTGIFVGILSTGGFENAEKIKEIFDKIKKLI